MSRVVVLTGATGSIGQAIANGLAKQQPTTLILALRNVDKGNTVKQHIIQTTGNSDIHIEPVQLDSIQSINEFTQRVTNKYGVINVLVNNAAVVPATKQYTHDNIELQFGVNVFGYYLLSELFVPLLHAGAQTKYGARIVNVASNYAGHLDINDLQFNTRSYNSNTAYMQSKQANRMVSWKLADRYKPYNINVYAVHPGVVTSNVLGSLGMAKGYDSPEQGASTPVFAANDPSLKNKTGVWLDKCKITDCKFKNDPNSQKLIDYLDQLKQKSK